MDKPLCLLLLRLEKRERMEQRVDISGSALILKSLRRRKPRAERE